MSGRFAARLDLLPLLDVFMVVLFVFAVSDEERANLAEVERVRERERRIADAKAQAELRERMERRIAELEAIPKMEWAPREDADLEAQLHVLDGLLERHRVVEIEIDGRWTPSGVLRNVCCYRTDPRSSSWTACGDVSWQAAELTPWWTSLSPTLVEALAEVDATKGVAIVSQNDLATFEIAEKVASFVQRHRPTVHLDTRVRAKSGPVCPD